MGNLIESIRSLPWVWAWLAFFAVVFLRAGGTYLIGRAIAAGLMKQTDARPKLRQAMDFIGRWGAPGVMLSFLTVGAQTVINLAAGLVRMPWHNYLLGLIPGAAIWATIWSTIGMAAFYAVIFYGGQESTAWLVAAVTLVVAVFLVVLAARSRQPTPSPGE